VNKVTWRNNIPADGSWTETHRWCSLMNASEAAPMTASLPFLPLLRRFELEACDRQTEEHRSAA